MKNTFITVLIILVGLVSLKAQIINIPDPEFKQTLLNIGADINGDNEIDKSEALLITELDLRNNTQDLTGLEAFDSLRVLDLSNCKMKVVKLRNFAKLYDFECKPCDLDTLLMENIPSLGDFEIDRAINLIIRNLSNLWAINWANSDKYFNTLTLEDLPLLRNFEFEQVHGKNILLNNCRNISSVYLRKIVVNTALEDVTISNCENIRRIHISGRTWLKKVKLNNLPKLTELEIYDTPQDLLKILDLQNISNVEELVIKGVDSIDLAFFPNLLSLTLESIDNKLLDFSNQSRLKQVTLKSFSKLEEIKFAGSDSIEFIDFQSIGTLDTLIFNLRNSLTGFVFNNCSGISNLEFKNYPNLKSILIRNSNVQNVYIENNIKLEDFEIRDSLKEVYLYNLPKLTELQVNNSYLEAFSLEEIPRLTRLDLRNNKLKKIDLKALVNLRGLYLSYNKLDSVDLVDLGNLERIEIDNNNISYLGIDENQPNLSWFGCQNNNLKNLKLINLNALRVLNTSSNDLDTLVLLDMGNLTSFNVSHNNLKGITVTNFVVYDLIDFSYNKLDSFTFIQEMPRLEFLDMSHNNLKKVKFLHDMNGLEEFDISHNQLNYIDLEYDFFSLEKVNLSFNELDSLSFYEGSNVKTLDLQYNNLTNLLGIPFEELTTLNIGSNSIHNFESSTYPKLEELEISNNGLSMFNQEKYEGIKELNLSGNSLSQLAIVGSDKLNVFKCDSCVINRLVLANDEIRKLFVRNAIIGEMAISQIDHLNELNISGSELENVFFFDVPKARLDLSNKKIKKAYLYGRLGKEIDLSYNDLEYIDLSKTTNLDKIKLHYNLNLHSVNLLNRRNQQAFFYECNALVDVCCDEGEKHNMEATIDAHTSHHDFEVNTNCNSIPSEGVYKVGGEGFLDLDDNSCQNKLYKYQNFYIESNFLGETLNWLPVNANEYLALGVIGENTYKFQSKSIDFYPIVDSIMVAFPTVNLMDLEYEHDICFKPDRYFLDFQSKVGSRNLARPGFEWAVSFFVKNKGVEYGKGFCELRYNDTLVTFVSSDPAPISVSNGVLKWQFDTLYSQEYANFNIRYLLNSPMDTIPLNDGDLLSLEFEVFPEDTDAYPLNNIKVLNTLVRNSYDPNDKTCLQGPTITQEQIGKELDFLIRFENKGTAEAINIIVKDRIDTSIFEISSLTVNSVSHESIEVRITESNLVSFIFKDIYLPFENDQNDGFIGFSIKTKDHLILGDTIKNTAEIYFDFNWPIITNTATTTVADPVFIPEINTDLAITLSPNPVSDQLSITSEVAFNRVELIDMEGRMVKVVSYVDYVSSVSINLGALTSQVYQVMVWTKEGVAVERVVVM